MELSIIIPAYNEEKNLDRTVKSYIDFFRNKKVKFEIMIATDGCKDKTPEIAKKISREYREVKSINFKERKGKGGGIIEAFKRLEGNWIGFTDADGSTPAEEFYKLYSYRKGFDALIGSRWVKGAEKKGLTIKRKILSRGLNMLARSLFFLPYKDTQCGAKLLKRRTLKRILNQLQITDWAFDINLLYALRKSRARIREIAVNWKESDTQSHINYKKAVIQMTLSLIRLRLIYSPVSKIKNKFISNASGKIYHLFEK